MMTLRLGLFIAYTIIILVGHTNYDGDYKGTTGVAVGYFFIWLMGFSIFFAFKNNSDSSVSATPQLKKCPHCAEKVMFEAKKCKHCGEKI